MTEIKTNQWIKNFFTNNWLSLLIIVGIGFGIFYASQRLKEINQRNSELQSMLQDQRDAIQQNNNTISSLNNTIDTERQARAALKAEYDTQLQNLRTDLETQIDRVRRGRTARTTELRNNPSELVRSYNNAFGFGRGNTP
jgi:septal ring factor EnvC (AmiA/AmiB activator)